MEFSFVPKTNKKKPKKRKTLIERSSNTSKKVETNWPGYNREIKKLKKKLDYYKRVLSPKSNRFKKSNNKLRKEN